MKMRSKGGLGLVWRAPEARGGSGCIVAIGMIEEDNFERTSLLHSHATCVTARFSFPHPASDAAHAHAPMRGWLCPRLRRRLSVGN